MTRFVHVPDENARAADHDDKGKNDGAEHVVEGEECVVVGGALADQAVGRQARVGPGHRREDYAVRAAHGKLHESIGSEDGKVEEEIVAQNDGQDYVVVVAFAQFFQTLGRQNANHAIEADERFNPGRAGGEVVDEQVQGFARFVRIGIEVDFEGFNEDDEQTLRDCQCVGDAESSQVEAG